MPILARVLAACLTLGLVACGNQEAAPTAPRQVFFDLTAVEGTPFEVVEIRSANTAHYPCAPAGEDAFTAPYSFFLENAPTPIQGTFQPVDAAQPIEEVALSLGGEGVARQVVNPTADTPITTDPAGPTPPGSPSVPCRGTLSPGAHEVRFDVSGQPRDAVFGATIGHQKGSHLLSSAAAPVTIFLDNAQERVSGVFAKRDQSATLSVRLYVDGVQRDSATIDSGSNSDAVVQYEF